MNSERGQSLVEFIIIVPLFFIVLSGLNIYLNQEIKNSTEEAAIFSLKLSETFFDLEERIQANWSKSNLSKPKSSDDVLEQSFNPSAYFFRSIDQKNNVFSDKEKVKADNSKVCHKSPSYRLQTMSPGKFQLSTCADSKGFESSVFEYNTSNKDSIHSNPLFTDESVYVWDSDFAWKHRNLHVSKVVSKFTLTPEGVLFSKSYASLVPFYTGHFNSKCFMDPYEPECTRPGLSGKWRRAAYDGANVQVVECFTEMSLKCLRLGAPPAIAACVAEGTAEISSALSAGQQAGVCPILNRSAELIYNSVLLLTLQSLI